MLNSKTIIKSLSTLSLLLCIFILTLSGTSIACRLYGAISDNLPDGLLQSHLIDEPNSLKKLAQTDNMDGWGITSYHDYGDSLTIERGAERAFTDTYYDTVVGDINTSEPRITIAHIRHCTSGCCDHDGETIDDPHPFYRDKDGKRWTFAHNGGVAGSLLRSLMGEDYLNENPPNGSDIQACMDSIVGSELYFLFILKKIEENNWNAVNGIVEAVTELIDNGEKGMNFLLSDGHTVWAFRKAEDSHQTLYYLYDPANGYSAVTSQYPSNNRGNWIALNDNELVILTGDDAPVIIDIANLLFSVESDSGCDPEEALWSDEFTSLTARWENYTEGTGYKLLTTIDDFSVVEIGITDRASSSSYSDCSLHEKYYHYNTGVFEMRLRYTGNNEFGTLGWGVWNYENPQAAEAAWFWSSTTGGVAVGFQAMVAYGGIIRFQEHLPEINIQEWHTYRVDLLPTGTRFLVDGNEVAFTPLRPNKSQRFEIWVDNYRMKVTNGRLEPIGYLDMDQDHRIYIDWVRYYEECVEEVITPPATITQLTYDDFESGWGSYTDGGGDCGLYTGGTYAHQGSNAANIQDNSGQASSFYHTGPIDVHTAGYTQIEIDFWFYPRSMESGEDFWVQYYDGSSWHTVASYARGTDFSNGQFYHETVYVNEGTYAFPTNMKIRFQCDASGNYDDVYIDEVKVSGITPGEIDNDEDGYNVPEDCDDNNPEINPGATEVCDEVDNDCDGAIDEEVCITYYKDVDNDTHGMDGDTRCLCDPEGDYTATWGGDCDDLNSAINPWAIEVCDEVDNNCNGQVDEGLKNTYYRDADGDGYGDTNNTTDACSAPPGYVSDNADCRDTDPDINPGAAEICDGKDNNCNGDMDEGLDLSAYYRDADGDGYGDTNNTTDACSAPPGYVSDNTDCRDTDPDINPGAAEVCDDKDNNCNGDVDEGLDLSAYYRDADGDGYGDTNNTTDACSAPPGYVSDNTDCRDTDPDINPGAAEVCDDDIDNDCDELIDSDDSDCVSEQKSFCGAEPMYGDSGRTNQAASNSVKNALLPLLPSMMALGLWRVKRAGRSRKKR